MHVIACAAPSGALEPAPLTSLPIDHIDQDATRLDGFWSDDAYYVRTERDAGDQQWFRIESGHAESDAPARELSVAGIVADQGARLGGVSFALGSAGRTVFRVWRSKGADRPGRTRILAVRAARSRRLPA